MKPIESLRVDWNLNHIDSEFGYVKMIVYVTVSNIYIKMNDPFKITKTVKAENVCNSLACDN